MLELTTLLRSFQDADPGRRIQTKPDSLAELKITEISKVVRIVGPDTKGGSAEKESSRDLQRDFLASGTE